MRFVSSICWFTMWASWISAQAASIIPAEKRVPVRITATLSAPSTAPMHMPTDVAVDSQGRVYVADGANDRVVRFDANTAFDRSITHAGDQKLTRPVGLAVDARDRLWIADTGSHRLLIMEPDGRLAEAIDLPAGSDHAFDPTDVAVTADGRRVYIVDNENHRLAIRDNDSGQIHFLGGFGEAQGRLRWPFMVCLGPDGYVYITEAIGARVQRLTPDDRWAGQVGTWGVEMGQLYRPKGLAFSPRGHLLVTDSSLNVIQVFGPRGELRGVLTGEDGRPFVFQHPMGLAFDSRGRLYVTELKANRVAVVELPSEWTASRPATQPEAAR